MERLLSPKARWTLLSLSCSLFLAACGGAGSSDEAVMASNPQQAASQLEQAFANSPGDVKENAGIASDALRSGDYEKAVVALEAIRAKPDVSLEQGLAIHSSAVMMEARLIQAAAAGDERAKRAYELLKRMKRN